MIEEWHENVQWKGRCNMLNYKKVEGSQEDKPLAVDTVSSSTTVYIRKNIKRKVRKDEQSGSEIELWEYDEAQIDKDQYIDYLTEKLTRAEEAIDFLLMGGDLNG